jgi:DNA-binding MarR family transcriptional regulator
MKTELNSLQFNAAQEHAGVEMNVAGEPEAEMGEEYPASADVDSPSLEAMGITHIEIVRVIERLHRRSLDLIRADLIRAGIDDLSPSQVMMLLTIGQSELSVRDLIERGYYLGSNASYSLKRLVEAEYVVRTASERDRRSARIRLSKKGQQLCDMIKTIDRTYHRLVTRNEEEVRELESTFRTLKRLEEAWSNAVRYWGLPTDE